MRWGRENATGGDELRFLMLGDWGRNGRDYQRDVAAQMARAASRPYRFVVSTGDNFYEDGVTTPDDPQWRTSFEEVYAAPELDVPWYCLLGNHDYHGTPQAQLEYAKRNPRWRMPGRYYAAIEQIDRDRTVRFFFVDTSPFVTEYRDGAKTAAEVCGQDWQAQLRWLDGSLEGADEGWKIVVGHHPIYSGGAHGPTPELIERLLPLLRKHSVQVYVCGHEHDLQHIARDGLHYFVSGAGSMARETGSVKGTRFARGVPGFLSVSLASERLRAEFFNHHGRLLHRAEVPRIAV